MVDNLQPEQWWYILYAMPCTALHVYIHFILQHSTYTHICTDTHLRKYMALLRVQYVQDMIPMQLLPRNACALILRSATQQQREHRVQTRLLEDRNTETPDVSRKFETKRLRWTFSLFLEEPVCSQITWKYLLITPAPMQTSYLRRGRCFKFSSFFFQFLSEELSKITKFARFLLRLRNCVSQKMNNFYEKFRFKSFLLFRGINWLLQQRCPCVRVKAQRLRPCTDESSRTFVYEATSEPNYSNPFFCVTISLARWRQMFGWHFWVPAITFREKIGWNPSTGARTIAWNVGWNNLALKCSFSTKNQFFPCTAPRCLDK